MKQLFLKQPIYIILIILVIIILYPICLNFFIDSSNERGVFGDSFGALNTFFSALAFCGVVISIIIQRKDFDESKYQYLHDRMTSFMYVQLDRYEKILEKLEIVNNDVKICNNEALIYLFENLKPIYIEFAETREQRLNIALNSKEAILQNLNLIKESNSKISSFIISTDNCFLTLNDILNTSELTINDKNELKSIFNKNLGYMFPSLMKTMYNTIYLARMFSFQLDICYDDFSSLMTLLNRIQYFQIFHHGNKNYYS
ncbi:hypothetical protein BBI01_12635 [Chryseobacterium artocarpi]|uniref:Phage abortive infection protein n=1 Tax=Chryseobacterium artocarpi TaxID=1414727 RepID=A0A1B8ZGR9_9FLAO|nr:hypothetical protein [Chryseobacterium artocarpi]OCA70781.1 hypothetical protein BBI01_12635 [Chryseobacterium artocarpi]